MTSRAAVGVGGGDVVKPRTSPVTTTSHISAHSPRDAEYEKPSVNPCPASLLKAGVATTICCADAVPARRREEPRTARGALLLEWIVAILRC